MYTGRRLDAVRTTVESFEYADTRLTRGQPQRDVFWDGNHERVSAEEANRLWRFWIKRGSVCEEG